MATTVRAVEGKRKKLLGETYILGISATIDQENPIEEEIRHVNEAMINWLKSRGKKADSINFVYIAHPDQEGKILQATEALLLQDFEWKSVLKGLREIMLVIINPETGEKRERQVTLQK